MDYRKQTTSFLKTKPHPQSLSLEEREATKGFTLVELIVVVTILAILATIGFVSYSSYLTGVRDTNRLAQLVSIHDGLELYRTKKDLPLPDESVDVIIGSDPIAYQGYAGSNTLETIDFTKGGLDPRDKSYFSYYLTADRKYFQLMAFLEEEANITTYLPPHLRGTEGELSLTQQTRAVDYSLRIPTIYGKKLGILTDTENTPIQEIQTIKDNGELDISSTEDTSGFIAHFTDVENISGTGGALSMLESILTPASSNPTSCKEALSPNTYRKNGIYKIKLNGINKEVYCDMTSELGGWTLVGNFNAGGLAYTGSQIGNPSTFFETSGGKLSDQDINSISSNHFKYEGVKVSDYDYSEFLYCDSISFDYSGTALASGLSTCSRIFYNNYNGYVTAGTFGAGYTIAHWTPRDVWIRDNSSAGVRWQTDTGNPGGYIGLSGEVAYYKTDIRLWVK